jgi:hypothetical protein
MVRCIFQSEHRHPTSRATRLSSSNLVCCVCMYVCMYVCRHWSVCVCHKNVYEDVVSHKSNAQNPQPLRHNAGMDKPAQAELNEICQKYGIALSTAKNVRSINLQAGPSITRTFCRMPTSRLRCWAYKILRNR